MGVPKRYASITATVTHGEIYAAEDLDDPVIEIGEIEASGPWHPWRTQIRIDRLDDVIAALTEIRRRRAESGEPISLRAHARPH